MGKVESKNLSQVETKTRELCLLLFVLVLWLRCVALGQSGQPMGDWPCYDAKPGHPTNQEKTQFLIKITPSVKTVERKFGTPASALVAMSMQESGYGWTRTALFANNLFGYKFTSFQSAGGRKAWELDCQPTDDPNNKYVMFGDIEDCISFVAGKLSRLDRYRAATDRYQETAKRYEKVPAETIDAWVEDVAKSGYNPDPSYPKRVERIMHNYLVPSDTVSARYNLYVISQQEQARHPHP